MFMQVLEECANNGACQSGEYCFSCPLGFVGSRCVRSQISDQFKLVVLFLFLFLSISSKSNTHNLIRNAQGNKFSVEIFMVILIKGKAEIFYFWAVKEDCRQYLGRLWLFTQFTLINKTLNAMFKAASWEKNWSLYVNHVPTIIVSYLSVRY